jgi:hypothetical protein
MPGNSEADIFGRVLDASNPTLTPEVAKAL